MLDLQQRLQLTKSIFAAVKGVGSERPPCTDGTMQNLCQMEGWALNVIFAMTFVYFAVLLVSKI